MDQAVLVEMIQGSGEREADLEALLEGQAGAVVQLAFEAFGSVGLRVDLLAGLLIVGQFHDVVEVAGLIVAADVEDVDLTVVRAGNRLKLLDALEFPFERPVMLEGAAINDFDGAISAHDISRQPDLAVTAAAYFLQQLVVGNGRD